MNNREHQRFDFDSKRWVKILKVGLPSEDYKMYRLLDISQGGLSFIVNSVGEFKRKDQIIVIELEGTTLERPLHAQVMYVQNLDEYGVDYKVGIEFIKKVKRARGPST